MEKHVWSDSFKFTSPASTLFSSIYFLRSIRVGTIDWVRPFPADASLTSSAGNSRATESPQIVVKHSYFCETEEVFYIGLMRVLSLHSI